MKKRKFNTASFILVLLVFYTGIVVLIWQQTRQQINEDRSQTITAAIHHHNNLVFAFEQHTVRTLQEADAVLHLTKFEVERFGTAISLRSFLNKGLGKLPVFDGLAIFDAKGNLVNSFPEELKHQTANFAGRDHFKIHQSVADTLFISKPFVSSSLKKPVIVISRRLNDKAGRFMGTVALQILPSTFMSFYKEATLNQYDILSLISPDGMTYSRRTGNVESSGENISRSPLFQHLQRRPIGSYFAKDAIRQIPTYFSYRKLKAYPVIATVGSSEEELLGKFYERRKKANAVGVVLTVLFLAFCAFVFRSLLRRRRAIDSLINNEAKYRSIFNGSQDAIFLLSPCGKVEAINDAARLLFRIHASANELYFHQLYAADKSFPVFYSQIVANKEVVFERLDTSKFIGEIAASSFTDADGSEHFLLLIRNVSARKRMEKQLTQERKRHQLELTKHIITAQENEREVIGRELHDNVNQVLTTVKLYLESALETTDETKNELIRRSVRHVAQSINEIRNLSHSLSAPTLATHSLIDSIKVLADNMRACSRMTVTANFGELLLPVTKDQSLALYRIVQEQLNNIIKHSNARSVAISLYQTGDETTLVVKDDGKGFAVQDSEGGIGIRNMESRTKAFGGKFSITAAPGKGCAIEVSLPIEHSAALKESWC